MVQWYLPIPPTPRPLPPAYFAPLRAPCWLQAGTGVDNKNVRLALAALFLNLAVAAHQVGMEIDGRKRPPLGRGRTGYGTA